MQNVLAVHDGRFRRVADAIRRYELKLLRGLTWSHFGYVALISVAFSVGRALQNRAGENPAGIVWDWMLQNLTSGLFVLFFAITLTNANRPRIPRPAVLAIAVVAGCTLGVLLAQSLWWSPYQPTGWSIHKLRVALQQWALVAVLYYFVERSARRAAELRKAELERHRLEAQMLEARLQVLQAQVEPHFLFNTLAHVQRLYQTDPSRGRSMLDSFCGYLCAALPQMRSTCSTVSREVDLAQAYLDTQRIRMGRRLRFEIAIPDALRAAAFPPMMLLPLVENAVKHGLSPLRDGGTIKIVAASDGDMLQVTVADTGAGFSPVDLAGGNGVGLSNARSRAAALYGGRAHVKLARNVPRGVIATIGLPLRFDSGSATVCQGGQSSPPVIDSPALGTVP